jgi:hypothetical protein
MLDARSVAVLGVGYGALPIASLGLLGLARPSVFPPGAECTARGPRPWSVALGSGLVLSVSGADPIAVVRGETLQSVADGEPCNCAAIGSEPEHTANESAPPPRTIATGDDLTTAAST